MALFQNAFIYDLTDFIDLLQDNIHMLLLYINIYSFKAKLKITSKLKITLVFIAKLKIT